MFDYGRCVRPSTTNGNLRIEAIHAKRIFFAFALATLLFPAVAHAQCLTVNPDNDQVCVTGLFPADPIIDGEAFGANKASQATKSDQSFLSSCASLAKFTNESARSRRWDSAKPAEVHRDDQDCAVRLVTP
jgi:hypothetical protein